MRNTILILSFFIKVGIILGQVPIGFSFQTIIRDSEGKVQKNQSVSLRFSILEGSESGTTVYSETHSKTTNEFGVINLTVGTGTPVSGIFSSIVWGSNIHFLKTEIDPTGGSSYSISTTSQLMSVPYAMYAAQADTALKVPDTSPTNEIQVLSISNDSIYLSDGGFAQLPPDEPQKLSVSPYGDTLFLSGGNYVIVPGISGANPSYPSGTVHCTETPTAIVDVYNPATGKTWMDRNLGASQAATSSTDTASYGDLYQWGRRADGHQCRNSLTTGTVSTTDKPGHNDFITNVSSPYDWLTPINDNLWQGESGSNNPCPSGYRLPTQAEWEEEIASWSSKDADGAFATPLKLPIAGYRNGNGGHFGPVGTEGRYWSTTILGSYTSNLSFSGSAALVGANGRASGNSVRCIKD